ncbi:MULTISPECIES: DUF6707 family protein [Bacteroidales]|jgi:hypothetical protein|uniref:Uncharacterized protein n=4 Tax=Bacteroidaceae TaxID=815 RepID=A0A412YW17_9BACT|nr:MULTISPECIES: DUF6707 family protein [Bacteroidales]RHK28417.1 hypothetical protein DW069_25225 [Bacteroides thetaiotaomicron]RGV02908.1 hypothetical protein DWW25_25850 [Bacteroides xylanisolvens]RGV32052.1 hypothetical protein DWW14_24485 [Bacteroides uniformis]RGV58783.1 hypothetical protein DWW08_02345 [Bacteroides fragilis]RGV70924.1 hypothetical protein DWW04_19270 [Phocaeicola dorei]
MEQMIITVATELLSIKNKRIESLSKKVLKKMNFKSSKDLENLKDLCYWLYIYGHNNQFAKLYSTLLSIPFSGNWNTWTQVELMLALVYYVSIKTEDTQVVSKQALAKIMQAETDIDSIKSRCDGSLLENRKQNVQESIQLGNKTDIREALYAEMRELVLIYALGGSDKYPLKTIENRIENIKSQLQTM